MLAARGVAVPAGGDQVVGCVVEAVVVHVVRQELPRGVLVVPLQLASALPMAGVWAIADGVKEDDTVLESPAGGVSHRVSGRLNEAVALAVDGQEFLASESGKGGL